MSAKHTPGPWVVHPLKAQVDCQKLCDDGTLLPVCQLLWPTDYCSEDETFANGRLIAAAPELYEACQEAILRCSMSQSMRSQLHAALRKARGDQ